MGNIQLIPSRLPTGEIALIMPSALNTQVTSSLTNSGNQANPNKRPEPERSVGAPSQPLSSLTSTGQRLSAFSRPPPNRKSAAPTTLSSSLLGCNLNTSQGVNSSGQYLPPIEEKVLALQTLQQPSSTASPPLSPISSLCSQNEDANVVPHAGTYPRPSTPIVNAPISPSSSMESCSSHNNRNLQQQQVSSTSGSNNTSTSSTCSDNNGSISSGFISDISGKRSYSEMSGCGGSSSGSSEDEPPPLPKRCNTKEFNALSQEPDDQDRMWRPW